MDSGWYQSIGERRNGISTSTNFKCANETSGTRLSSACSTATRNATDACIRKPTATVVSYDESEKIFQILISLTLYNMKEHAHKSDKLSKRLPVSRRFCT
mmetsp:Transcript_2398/g.4834  ORF Transcript_2398/g.4834 Transcript_2398/m.4834 type:complete len:100 (+) Transcript_2398:1407-1706(+)